jgi:hypothetical protein
MCAVGTIGDKAMIWRLCDTIGSSLWHPHQTEFMGLHFSRSSIRLMDGTIVTGHFWHFGDIHLPKYHHFRALYTSISRQLCGFFLLVDLNLPDTVSRIKYWEDFLPFHSSSIPIILLAHTSKHTASSLMNLTNLRTYLASKVPQSPAIHFKEVNLENRQEIYEILQYFMRLILKKTAFHSPLTRRKILYEKIIHNRPLDEIDREFLSELQDFEEIITWSQMASTRTGNEVISLLNQLRSVSLSDFWILL